MLLRIYLAFLFPHSPLFLPTWFIIDGIVEFKNGNLVKQAEFLIKLINYFNDQGMEPAKYLLDDYVVFGKFATDLPILRDHRENGIETTEEIKIRDSFDLLFNFFSKLAYYRHNNLITNEGLQYFKD